MIFGKCSLWFFPSPKSFISRLKEEKPISTNVTPKRSPPLCPKVVSAQQKPSSFLQPVRADTSHFSANTTSSINRAARASLIHFRQFLFGYKVSVSQHCSTACLPWGLRDWLMATLLPNKNCWGIFQGHKAVLPRGVTGCSWAVFIDVKPLLTTFPS